LPWPLPKAEEDTQNGIGRNRPEGSHTVAAAVGRPRFGVRPEGTGITMPRCPAARGGNVDLPTTERALPGERARSVAGHTSPRPEVGSKRPDRITPKAARGTR